MDLFGVLVGLVLLVVGAELVVREGSALAARMGIHPIVVGLTVVSLGTSLPELAVGLDAAARGNGGLAVGNIVGTNLVNLLLILGIAAVMAPVRFEQRTMRFDLPVMTGAAVLLLLLALDGALSTRDGVWLCLYGVGYLAVLTISSVRAARQRDPDGPEVAEVPEQPGGHPVVQTVVLLVGLGVIVAGSDLLVDGAVGIANDLGVDDAIIGLTVVAIGTSAPELVTTVVSTLRGDRDIAIGNLLGSSVLNIALILGPTVIAAPGTILVPDDVLAVDLLLMVAAAVVCIPVFRSKSRLGRVEGAVFVAVYLAYLTWLLSTRL
ncbi:MULTISPECIES: calcium/sodium antiporter [unclassified Nocardioides]|uniref:calcium/sodium antiporter n=1 Tax=unclassified Nocardioides TaxID=2615069 RepID=UPI00360FEF48